MQALILEEGKGYAAHYIQLGDCYSTNAIIKYQGGLMTISPLDREYPRTTFYNGTLYLTEASQQASELAPKKQKLDWQEMNRLLQSLKANITVFQL